MKEIKSYEKIMIQVLVLILFFGLAVLSLLPTLVSYFLLVKFDFTTLMFYSGVFMGLIYNLLEFIGFLYQGKSRPNGKLNYTISILPSSFLLAAFSWYFVIMANKILAESKEDSEFFQAVMIAFTVFFLTVKIGKEIKNLCMFYKKTKQTIYKCNKFVK